MAKSQGRKAGRILSNPKSPDRIWSAAFAGVIATFYFLYFLLRIDPRLIYQAQEPVFFFDRYFIAEFFKYPGGPNELVCGFLSQFFYHSWTGALLLTLVFVLLAWNVKLLIGSLGAQRPVLYLHWLPSILLLALHSNYKFPFVLTLGLLWALLGAKFRDRVKAYAGLDGVGQTVPIDVACPGGDYWPLPWYLRAYRVHWLTDIPETVGPLIIVSGQLESALARKLYVLTPAAQRRMYLYLFDEPYYVWLRPKVELLGFVRKDLWEHQLQRPDATKLIEGASGN